MTTTTILERKDGQTIERTGTSGLTVSNPYWEELQAWARDEIEWEYRKKWSPAWLSVPYTMLRSRNSDSYRSRDDLVVQYAWSIPDPVSLEFVARHLGPNAVEIGAGTGYYAHMLAQLGTHVVCYDIDPPHRSVQNRWHSPRTRLYDGLSGELRPVYREIYRGGPGKAANYTYPLFLCWPPMSNMAYKTLKAYAGNKLVYIGEGEGGCTADDQFFTLLGREWELVDQHQPIQWSGIHDWIEVYERKR